MPKLDKETSKVITDQAKIEETVGTQGWKLVRQMFADKLVSLDSITGMDAAGKDEKELAREIIGRQAAIDLVIQVIREVEGIALDSKSNREMFQEMKDNSLIAQFN